MTSDPIADLCTYDSRSASNPDGIQRSLDNSRTKQIAGFVREDFNPLPSGIVANLGSEVTILEDDDELKTVLLLFPDDSGDFIKIIDGQHRLEGLKCSEEVNFDLPVVAFHDVSKDLVAKAFADLNSNQKPVSRVHLLELADMMNSLKPVERKALSIVHALNDDADSPIAGKIKIRDDQTDPWITNVQLKGLIEPHLSQKGVLAAKSIETATAILKDYLNAVKETWKDIWEGDRKSYVLTWAIGFDVIFVIFAKIIGFCDLYEDRTYTAESFQRQMQQLVGLSLEFPELGTISLNWENETFRRLNNTAGKKDLIGLINLRLAQIDEVRLSESGTEESDESSPDENEEDASDSDELQ